MRHAVIVAGGVGSRLWPVSRISTPKQFRSFTSDRTLIQETFDRINKVIDVSNIWVITTESYREIATQQLPEISQERIIIEPFGRNTAPAIGLAMLTIEALDDNAVIGCFPADHYIGRDDIFNAVIKGQYDFIEKNEIQIATIGINPTQPNTGYGYIKMGDQLTKDRHFPIFKVEQFIEKPNAVDAKKYFESWDYLWNGGYFFFSLKTMKKLYKRLAPETLKKLTDFIKNPSQEIYQSIASEPIDKAIAEKIDTLAVMPADIDWSDIGNWSTMQDILQEKQNLTTNALHINVNSSNVMVVPSNKVIATVGVENLVVIDVDDALLICNREAAQDVKIVIDRLKEIKKDELL